MDENEAKSLASDWVRRLEASVLSKVYKDSDKLTNGGDHHHQDGDNVTHGFNYDLDEKTRKGAEPSPRLKIHHDTTEVSSTSNLINQNKEITRPVHQSNQEHHLRQTPRNTTYNEPRKHSPRVDLENLRSKRLERFDKSKSSVANDWLKNDEKSCEGAEGTSFDRSTMLQCEANPACTTVDNQTLRNDKWKYEPVNYGSVHHIYNERSNDEDDKLRLELWGIRDAVESGQIDITSYLHLPLSCSEDHSQNNSTKQSFNLGNSTSEHKDCRYESLRDNNYNLTSQSNHQKDFVIHQNGLVSEENLPLLTSKLSIKKCDMESSGAFGPESMQEDFTRFSVSKHQPSTIIGCTLPQIKGRLYNGFETSDSESSVNALKISHKYKAEIDHNTPDVTSIKSDKPPKSGKGKKKILNELTEFLDSGRNSRRNIKGKGMNEDTSEERVATANVVTNRLDIDSADVDLLVKSSDRVELDNDKYPLSPTNGLSTSTTTANLQCKGLLQGDSFAEYKTEESVAHSSEIIELGSSDTEFAKICTVCKEVNSRAANWCIECGTALINVKPALLNQEQQQNYAKQCQESQNLIEGALNSNKQELDCLGVLSKKERDLRKEVMQLSQELEKNEGFSNESLQSNLSSYKRRWLKSSIAWSTFEPQQLSKPPSSLVKVTNQSKKSKKTNKDKLNGSLRSRSSSDLAVIENSRKKNKSKNKHDHRFGERQRTASATYYSADDCDSSNMSINLELANQEGSLKKQPISKDRPRSAKSNKAQKSKSEKKRPESARTHSKSPSPLSLEDVNLPAVSAKASGNTTSVPLLNLEDVGSYDRILTLIRSQRDSEPVPYLCLPDELLLEIFSHLSKKDLVSCMCVCSQFYRIAMDETLWKTIIIRKNRNICDEWLDSIGDRHPSSITISQCSSGNVTSNGLRGLFRKCSDSLEEVNFSGCSGSELIGESILLHIAARCFNVVSVDVSWTNVSDNGVQALAESLKRLECLCLNGCQAITDKSLTYVSKKHGQSLRIFEVFGCFNITPAALLEFGSQCIHLQTLNIGQCHKMTDSAVGNLVSHLPEIENLDLRGCKQTRDSAVKKIVRHCPYLKSLVLANCPLITDSTLVEISTNLSAIRSLDICGCSYVTDAGIRALAKCCHKLELLDLSSTGTAVTSKSIVALSNYSGHSLRVLKLSFCSDVSVNTVNQVVKNCKKLKLLHLYGCKRIKEVERIKNLNPNLVIEK